MIFIRAVIIDAVMLDRAGQAPRFRLPTWLFFDVLTRRDQSDQIASELFGALPLYAQARPRCGAMRNCSKQWSQRIRLAAGDVRQLMRQHTDHCFI